MKENIPKLTIDDLAQAWFACGHGAAFWKKKGRGKYAKAEKAKYDALSEKLDRIINARERRGQVKP